ncbi:unnamed protein product (macronuclear) [Paramecium tetraurelia]|uniref:Response regulatory domain-containing protein n=1 Tax=Paramecium tetraurelia TaxID=5888 RepID=A0C2K6_PARTE|nr:uncharacterized protein GSPATT00034501001 [Paramecium tetraurelia]CAK65023.1 unnamed protein product [Paramecium tetraurelia]|eukprot:XP_001432420.1 hypothetical protein (macronuclear) [Paramecium tetraurelia strain d4-2]
MKILITLIVTQSISTIIGFTEFKEPQEVIALALELFGLAMLLLLSRMKYSELIQRILLICLATIIFVLMPNSQFKFYSGVYHIVLRHSQQKQLNRGLLLEWLVLLLVILIFGTSLEIEQICRSVFAGIAIMLMQCFKYQDQLQKEANKQQIMIQSKINYTMANNDGSNPRNIGERIVDPKVTSLFLDENYNVLDFQRSSAVYKLTDGDVQNLLQELHINKIDQKSKQLLPWKCNQISLKYFLDSVKNNAIPMVIQVIDYTHPKLENHIIKIIYQNDFEIQFYDVEEIDKYKKRNYVYAILKQLFNTMSHEFGTSLNYLLALSQVAIDKYNDVELQSYFQPIKATGLIMYHFVLDMIDFNALLGKKLELYFEKIDIVEILYEIKSIFSHSLEQKGLTINFDVFLNEKTIFTDRRRLKQILITLISNAQKFTFKGGIRLVVKSVEKYVQFEVIDTGIGLSTSELEILTDVLKTDYKNEQQISKNTAGFGLGSYLCNKIAMSLSNLKYEDGGGIRYSNNQGEIGTMVTFKILNEQLNYNFVSSQDNSSGIIKIGKNVIVDLKQSQIELSLSGLKKPLTKRFSTVMVPKVKSFHDDQHREHSYFKQPTKDCFQGMQMQYTKIDSDSVNEETNEEDYQKRLQIQNLKLRYYPSDILRELRQQSVGISEHYVLDCKCKTILIVDDEMINILGLQLMLKSLFFEADHAFNGLEAIKMLEQAHCMYSIIFMDINMPIMDGYVTTKAILNKYKAGSPKIIACTAFTDSQTRQGCYEVGMSHFINKPVDKTELQKLLCYLIN